MQMTFSTAKEIGKIRDQANNLYLTESADGAATNLLLKRLCDVLLADEPSRSGKID